MFLLSKSQHSRRKRHTLIHVIAVKHCRRCYDMMLWCDGDIAQEEFVLPMVMWKVVIREASEKRGVWSGVTGGKETHEQKKDCVKWHGGSSRIGEWLGSWGSSWDQTVEGLLCHQWVWNFFLQQRWAIAGIKRESNVGGYLGFRGTALTLDREWNAISMSHGWDVVIWGWEREQSPGSVSAWVIIALTCLRNWGREQILGKK